MNKFLDLSELQREIMKATLDTLTLEELDKVHRLYGTRFIINDGHIIDII